jgi:hypothetical protein
MDDHQFNQTMRDVLAAFRSDDDGYTALMDTMATRCSDDQWATLVRRLDEEADSLKAAAQEAERRSQHLPLMRPVKDAPVDGTV